MIMDDEIMDPTQEGAEEETPVTEGEDEMGGEEVAAPETGDEAAA